MLARALCAASAMTMSSAQLHASPRYAHERRVILALRAQNNRAIAAHKLDATTQLAAPDYVLVGGSGGIERSAAESRKGWAEEFATEGFDRYVRTTTQVDVGEHKGVLRAAELGKWRGNFHKAAGVSAPFGRYFVHWSKATGRWRIVSETYVTLGCKGHGC